MKYGDNYRYDICFYFKEYLTKNDIKYNLIVQKQEDNQIYGQEAIHYDNDKDKNKSIIININKKEIDNDNLK